MFLYQLILNLFYLYRVNVYKIKFKFHVYLQKEEKFILRFIQFPLFTFHIPS